MTPIRGIALLVILLMLPGCLDGGREPLSASLRCASYELADADDQVVVEVTTALDRRVDMGGHSIFQGRINSDTYERGPGLALEFAPDACAAAPLPKQGRYVVHADTGGSQLCRWTGEKSLDFQGGTAYVVLQLNETNQCLG